MLQSSNCICTKRTIVLKVYTTTFSYAKVGNLFNSYIKDLNTVNSVFRLKYLKATRRTQSLIEFSK
jgi:hypothetical protein